MSWTLFGELSFAAGQWFSLMVVAKLGSPEALGRYSLGLAVATPIIIFANLHLRPIYVVDTQQRWRFADYLGLRTLLLPAALFVTAAICLVRGWPWQTAAVVALLGLIRISGSVSDILYARAQRAEKMTTIGISRAARGVLWIGLLALGLVLADEVVALTMVAAALWIHTLVYDLRKAAAYEVEAEEAEQGLRPRFDREKLASLAKEALPMGLAGGILGLSSNVFAFVLEHEHGLEALGFFAAILSIRQASGVVNMALGNAAIARLAKLSVSNARAFWRLLVQMLGLVLVLNGAGLVLIVLIGDLFLRYAYTAAYVPYHPQLIIGSAAAVIMGLASMLSQTLTALSRFRLQLGLNCLNLIAALGFGLWRIPGGGVTGAVEALLMLASFRCLMYVIANVAVGPRNTNESSPESASA